MNEISNQHDPIAKPINGAKQANVQNTDTESISQTIKYPNGGYDLNGRLRRIKYENVGDLEP